MSISIFNNLNYEIIINNNETIVKIKLKNKKNLHVSHLPNYKKVKSDNNNLCSICQDNYKKGQYYRKLPCNHQYHKKCIDKWFHKDSKMQCPLCRKSFSY